MSHSSLRAIIKKRPQLYAQYLRFQEWLGKVPVELEFALIPMMCEPGTAVFDVGANIGAITRILVDCADRVVAFEPIPALAQVLQARFRSAVNARKLLVENCAVSNHNANVDLFVPDGTTGLATVERRSVLPVGSRMRVRCRTLDDFMRERVSFIKIDVEGHECSVVAGGLNLIRRDMPSLLIEAEERHQPESLNQLSSMLLPLGYEGYFLMGGELHPVSTFKHDVHQNLNAINATGTAKNPGDVYINNFLFFRHDAPALTRLAEYLGIFM